MKVFFQFGSLEFGKVYKLANTTYDQIEAKTLKDLNELGFVYYCKSGRSDSIEFIPTRLICILTGASVSSINTTISLLSSSKTTSFNDYSGVVSGGNAGADGSNMGTLAKTGGSGNEEDNGGASDPGFIIVETNYRLYAYTGKDKNNFLCSYVVVDHT
ncbi:RNA polymerase II transcription factor B subunit 2 [Zancudomyces culisetae]|uniref:RNA polymerase II transcription factor B subunit 2 n=1 Tax=Zancudomyces culisetae TaxID=1213189 RepID=A0A1R1PHA0_ZANCU|nr:RNA polymerase II transcription factor B subunit 2 [Zancudomyces culisetae]|eukprot:OMH80317.1 RNA polymerase II transcription factor B subunit 2 [Zancudomyces culisetae]